MQDIIEPIIHKAAVNALEISVRKSGLSIGDVAELHLCDDGRIAVYARIVRRRFFLRGLRLARIGYLAQPACPLLTPALRRGDHLRVRIVGLTPEHLSPDGQPEMHISVWGTARHFRVQSNPGQGTVPRPSAPASPTSSQPPSASRTARLGSPDRTLPAL